MRRVGLIGFGSIAEHAHLPAWHAFPGTRVTDVADLAPERLERARAALPDATTYTSPLKLIQEAGIDTLDICTPPNTHADLILAACRGGIRDIVCEKPFVLREEEYHRVVRASAEAGSRIVSVNNWRHSDLYRNVLSVLESGAIGAIRSVELQTGRTDCALGNRGWQPRWRTDLLHAGGGIILDHGWHQLYLVLEWTGAAVQEASAVTNTIDRRHFPVEDEATITLRFPAARATIDLSWTAGARTNGGMIRGADGDITIHDDRIEIQGDMEHRVLPFSGRLTESSYHPDWFEAMFRETVFTLDPEPAARTVEQAGVLVRIISTAYRSARLGGTLLPIDSFPCGSVPPSPGPEPNDRYFSGGGAAAQ